MQHPRIRSNQRGRTAFALIVGLALFLSSAVFAAAFPAVFAQTTQEASIVYLPLAVRPQAPVPPGAPQIDAFELSAVSGPMAAELELRWKVSGATSLVIEPGIGAVLGAASAMAYPVASTTYTLTASNDKGSVTATAHYTVNALPAPNPIAVAARPDPARAVAAQIGAAGGTITAVGADGTQYTLTVPPGALLYTEAITLTPIAAIEDMPFATTNVRAVNIAPEGLLFIDPATLTITPPTPPTGQLAGFAFDGDGAEFRLRTLYGAGAAIPAESGGSSSLNVVTAASFGTAPVADPDLLAPLVRTPPSDQSAIAEHVVNAAIDQALSATAKRLLLANNLRDDFLLFVELQLYRASLDPEGPTPFDLESAVRSYINWRAKVRAANLEELLRREISDANLLLGKALRKAGELATERCNTGRPAQGFALQRYIVYAKRFGLENTRTELEERLQKCWVFEVTFQSRMDQQDGNVRMLYELKASARLAYKPGNRIVGSAPLTWDRFEVTVDPECRMTPAGHETSIFNAEGDGLGLLIKPVSRTSPNVSISLSYTVGRPTAKWTVKCPEQPPVSFTSPLWWVIYAQTHSAELQGEIYTAQAASVHPNTFPGWIYDYTFINVVEHTEIALKHTPEH